MPPASPEQSTILVVDDTPENLLVLGEILQAEHRIRVANGGERALAVARTPPQPDLILLDVMMPDLDGYAVMERLRAHPETRDIPVIFVTALDGAEDEERGLALGAADFLTKPVRASIVRARVRTQLDLRAARQALSASGEAQEAERACRVEMARAVREAAGKVLAAPSGGSRPLAAGLGALMATYEALLGNPADLLRPRALDASLVAFGTECGGDDERVMIDALTGLRDELAAIALRYPVAPQPPDDPLPESIPAIAR